jgi:hypothetical protein
LDTTVAGGSPPLLPLSPAQGRLFSFMILTAYIFGIVMGLVQGYALAQYMIFRKEYKRRKKELEQEIKKMNKAIDDARFDLLEKPKRLENN